MIYANICLNIEKLKALKILFGLNTAILKVCFGWVGVYDISTFVGYLMPKPFLYIEKVLFQTI